MVSLIRQSFLSCRVNADVEVLLDLGNDKLAEQSQDKVRGLTVLRNLFKFEPRQFHEDNVT